MIARIDAKARVGVYRLLFTFLDFMYSLGASSLSRARARAFGEGRGVEACLLAHA